MSSGVSPPAARLFTTSGVVDIGLLVAACCCIGSEYRRRSLLSPKSNTILVFFLVSGFSCWMRNDSEGTVLRAVSEAGETKCRSGRVRCPADRAWTWTIAIVVSKGGEGGAVCLTKTVDMVDPESSLRTRFFKRLSRRTALKNLRKN
jgi:hypothetical protein